VFISRSMPLISNMIMAPILVATVVSGYVYLVSFKDLFWDGTTKS